MRTKRGIILLIFSIVINLSILVSPFYTSEIVYDKSGLGHVSFGFPIPFLEQDQSAYDPPYPRERELASPWEHPIRSIHLHLLLANLLMVNIPLFIIYYFLYFRKQ